MTNYNSGGILTDFGSLVKSTYILKILHDKAPLKLFSNILCVSRRLNVKFQIWKNKQGDMCTLLWMITVLAQFLSAFASENKKCKFSNKFICQLIWIVYKHIICMTVFSAFEVLKLIDKSADCSWKSTIFRAFASEDKNRAAFVTITSAAFDPEKATFSPDNKWWSCRDWRQSVMHGTAFRVLICICVCVFSPTYNVHWSFLFGHLSIIWKI